MTRHITTTIIESEPLSLAEIAQAVGADEPWVVQLVEIEILHVALPAAPPSQWRFGSAALQRAREVRRLERDFGTTLDAAALILDLQDELHRLRAVLAAHGLR
jgi:chaperone modulatory protein CbpM